MKLNLEQYQKLCVKHLSGETSKEEKENLFSWINSTEANKKIFDEYSEIWSATSPTDNLELPEIDFEWEKLNDKLNQFRIESMSDNSMLNKTKLLLQSLFTPSWKPVLGSVFVVLLVISSLIILQEKETSSVVRFVETLNKEKKEIVLEDGSIVKLNYASRIEYVEPFNDIHREIKLRGEAFFVVQKGKRPFIVTTEGAYTTVLGTKFNVKARNNKTEVIVKEGLVNLASSETESIGVNLPQNYLGSLVIGKTIKDPVHVDAKNLLGWLDNKIVFVQTPLNEIANELERFYDIPVELKNDSLSSLTLTGTFQNKEIDTILEMIALSLNIKVEKQTNGYIMR